MTDKNLSQEEMLNLLDDPEEKARMQELFKDQPHLLDDNQGYFEDESGEGHYNEDLAQLDKLTIVAVKDVKKIEKKQLYIKDDIHKSFDSALFDSNFENIYGNINKYDFKIYHFLKHHFSYGRSKLVRDMFEGEYDCIKNFMEIEGIVYRRADGTNDVLTEGYEIPFANSIKSYGDTFDFLKKFTTKLIKLLGENGIKRINHDPLLFKSEFERLHDLKMKEPVVELYEKIKFSGKTNYLNVLAGIMVRDDKNEDYKKAVELVLYHWIWKIKYKMQRYLGVKSPLKEDFSGYHPMVPVLYGLQGTGKTALINKLVQPFKEAGVSGQPTTVSLFENYTFDILSKNFTLVLDDFQQIERNKIPVFKDMISGDIRTGRQKGDQSSKNFRTFASFILATNEPLNEMVSDDTGNRRFFEIEVKPTYEALKNRNFLAIWKSVDENSPPITNADFDKYIKPFQEKNRKLTPQERFVNDYGLVAKQFDDIEEASNFRMVNIHTLLDIYNSKANGFKITTQSPAYKKLLECLGVKAEQINVKGNRDRVIYLQRTYSSVFSKLLDKFDK